MKALVFPVVVFLASFCLVAQAGITGKCTYEGKALAFVDGHAAMAPDPFEETRKVPMLWFSTKLLDHAALAKAKPDEIDDVMTDQAFEHESAELELRFDSEGKVVEGLQLYVPPGNNRSVGSNEIGKIQLKAPLVARANGRFILDDDDKLKCDLLFDIPMAGKGAPAPLPAAKPWGVALPAGGGEPGKVYMSLHNATLASDVNKMLSLVTKERAAMMRESQGKPEFPQMLEMVKAFEPSQVRIVSGRADATRAELQIDGKESDGAAMTGTVKLLKEAGLWKVESVSTKSKLKQ